MNHIEWLGALESRHARRPAWDSFHHLAISHVRHLTLPVGHWQHCWQEGRTIHQVLVWMSRQCNVHSKIPTKTSTVWYLQHINLCKDRQDSTAYYNKSPEPLAKVTFPNLAGWLTLQVESRFDPAKQWHDKLQQEVGLHWHLGVDQRLKEPLPNGVTAGYGQ